MANSHFHMFSTLLLVMWVVTEDASAQDCATGAEPDGSGGCASCTAGTFSSSVDDSSCAPCPAGSFADTGASSCTPCVAGLYDHDQRANTTCEFCPIGQFTLADGAQACQSCQDGSRWVRVHGEHGQRPAACEVCPVGFFLMGPEIEYCHRCPIGSYSPAVLPLGEMSSTFCRREDLVLDWMGGSYETKHAAFGHPEVLQAANFADVEVGIPDPSNACQSLSNTDAIAGKIAIVIRGRCSFAEKVMNAQDAGAVGVIIYNFNRFGLPQSEMAGEGSSARMVVIPSVFIDGAYGELLVAAVEEGATTVSLHCDSPFVEHPGCVSCTPGQYDHDSSPATECILCPPDTFSNTTGATTCESCPAGLFSAVASSTVEACNAAEFTYLGCYKDGPQQWDTIVVDTMGDIDFATESRDTCNSICSNYKYMYMGLTWSTQCRCGNQYGSTGLADLHEDGTTQCGVDGMNCGVGTRTCPHVLSIYTVSRTATCANVGDICLSGTTLKANASDIRAELDSVELQSLCCETSCATWGTTNDCSSGMFILDGADNVPIGSDSQLACCTSTCSANHTVDEAGRCHLCPAGSAPDLSGTQCKPCGAGSYVPAGSAECTACPAGQYDDDGVSTTPCVDCIAGQFSVTPGFCDGMCPRGTFAPSGSTSINGCEECVAGQYDHDGISITACLPCLAGSFSPDALTCSACPANTFSTPFSVACTACPTGRFTTKPQATSEVDCECPTGQFPGKEYTGHVRDAVGLNMRNDCVSCETGMQHTSHISKCPKDDMMVEWNGTSRHVPVGYPAGMYPTGSCVKGLDEFDPFEIYNTEVVIADPIDACTSTDRLNNAAAVAGKVVLIHRNRGSCLFNDKLRVAHDAGAWAVLMDDSEWTAPDDIFPIASAPSEMDESPMIALSIHRDLGYELREAIVNAQTCTGTLDEVPGSCSDGISTSQQMCEGADCSGSACEWTGPITPTCDVVVTPGVPAAGAYETPTLPAAHCPTGCDVKFPNGSITVSLHCGEPCPYGDLCNSVCFPCEPGTIDDDDNGATACVDCPENTYQDAVGSTDCVPCPFGQVSNEGASACSAEPLYLGCFEDRLSLVDGRDLTGGQFLLERGQNPTTSEFFHTSAIEECALRCTGYSYMSLQGALLCFCGHHYGTYEQLEDALCGDSGSLCGDGDDLTCEMQNAVFRVPHWTCADVACDAGTALLNDQASLSVLGQSHDEQQASCCATSCAAWNDAGNTCDVPGACSDNESATQQTCEAAECDESPCQWIAPQMDTRFISRLSEFTVTGSDPRSACCTAPCSPGQFEDGGRCENCPAGRISTTVDSTSCSPCATGQYAAEGGSACSSCSTGQYDHDQTPTTPCQQCPPGSFSNVDGATVCHGTCPAGTTGVAGANSIADCSECIPGQHDHDSNPGTPCLLCPRGRFSSAAGQIECESCGDGQASVGGSTACTPPDQYYAASQCPSQWLACSKSTGCVEDTRQALAAFFTPTHGPEELLALLQCVLNSTVAEAAPPVGCLDPLGSNYDDTKAIDNGRCVYECAALSDDISGDSICYTYLTDMMEWSTSVAEQQPFANRLFLSKHVVIQGVKYHVNPQEGSVDWSHYQGVHPSEITEREALNAWLTQSPQAACNYEWFNERLDWHAARDECISRGGNLASIHSEADNEAALQAIIVGNGGENTRLMKPTWIGANDERNEQGCAGGHGPVNATTRVHNMPEQTGVNFAGARGWGQSPKLYGGAGVTGPVLNVQTDVWEWSDGSPWDWTAWISHAHYRFTAPIDLPNKCDLNEEPVDYSTLGGSHTGSTCGSAGTDHVGMNWFLNGKWSTDNEGLESGTCLTRKHPYLCGYPCGPSWTAPLVTEVRIPTFSERFNLAGQRLTVRSVHLTQFRAAGGGGVDLGAVIDAVSGSNLKIEHVKFSSNIQTGVGAGVAFVDSSDLAIRFSEIRGNRNLGRGSGVVHARSSNVTVHYTNIVDSVSETSAVQPGLSASVMLLESCELVVVGTLFEENVGANTLVAVDSTVDISSTAFVKNVGHEPPADSQQSEAATQQTDRSGATVSLLQGSVAVFAETSFTENVGWYAGGLFISHVEAPVSLQEVTFSGNIAQSSDYGGGAIAARNAAVSGRNCSFNGNSAISPWAAGAIFSYRTSIVISDVSFSKNDAIFHPTAGFQAASGAILSDTDVLELARASFVYNSVDSGTVESWTGAEALYVVSPTKVKVVDTQYQPFVDVAGEGRSVLISPGVIQGILQGGCEQNPCQRGNKCTFANYSASCSPCPEKTYSSDGITCELCPPGFGATDDQTECLPCTGNNYSAFGVCQPCPLALVVGPGATSCEDCGVHRTAIQSPIPNTVATCGCENNYYNSSGSGEAALHVCFISAYDHEIIEDAKRAQREALQDTGQACQACPSDITGGKCLVCANGAQPTMAAGYTVPQLGDHATSRRAMRSSDGPEIVAVFRCHVEMDLAVKRCPLNPDYPGQCALGYKGKLCDTCIDGYGMDPSRECTPCASAGYTPESFALLGIILGALALFTVIFAKVWKAFPLKHIPRCAFQPGRILITYSQVTSQLGDVLDFAYPGVFGDVLQALKPVMDLWGLLFRALGPSECFGISGFTAQWLLRVVGLPGILSGIVLVVWAIDRYRVGPIKAQINMKGHVFFAIFFAYPTICIVCFASFICKKLGETPDGEPITVLSSDDSVFCEDSSHRAVQAASAVIIVVVAIGLPLTFGFILIRASRQYERDTADKNQQVAKRIATELDADEDQARWVVRDVLIGRDYSVLMDAYEPKYLYWEALDMFRKLALVGLVLLVGRGTVAQLAAAIVLSFGFFALQMKTWPYKLEADNLLRAATEMHVFIAISTALILKNDLSLEGVGVDVYDYILFLSFIVLVPGAAVLAVGSKVRYVSRLLAQERTNDALQRRQLAYDLQALGLAESEDIDVLKQYLEVLRMQLAGVALAQVVDGTLWAKNRGSVSARPVTLDNTDSDSDSDLDFGQTEDEGSATEAVVEQTHEVETFCQAASDDDVSGSGSESDHDDSEGGYYDKFTGGFEGTFADLSDFFGGLERLIGECRKDLMVAMEEEHCTVATGYGASNETFQTSSYRVVTTPREEWNFVVDPFGVGEMDAGFDRETGRSRGSRMKIPVESLLEEAAELITKSFLDRGYGTVITRADVRSVGLRIEEVIALRLYTGPMFEIYNGLLRAYGNRAARGVVPSYALVGAGQDVRGRFTTTLHVLNSGVLKLAKLQPAIPVYRGISGMKLPKSFTKKNKLNVRGGVEYGFMSATTDEAVALSFAKGGDSTTASTLVVATMGMIDRGATLDWLSQYPHEREVLLPPLTAMEVIEMEDFVDSGAFQIRKLHIRLNTNLVSMTIENLLSARKKQVSELIDIVAKDMSIQDEAADMERRAKSLHRVQAKLKRQPSESFNDNQVFLRWTQRKVLDLMPQIGNCIQELHGHSLDVYGLVQTNSGFLSSSWDGTLRMWSITDDARYSSNDNYLINFPSASVSLAAAGADHVVSGHLDGTVSVHDVSRNESNSDASEPIMLSHKGSSVVVSSLAARSGSSVLRTADVIVSVDETATLIPKGNPRAEIWIACGFMDGSISLWQVGVDTQRSNLVQSVRGCAQSGQGQDTSNVGHTSTVRAMVWGKHNANDVLISGSFDHRIIVWRLTSTNELDRLATLGGKHCAHDGAVTALAWVDHPSSASIVSAGEDGVVKLWDLDAPTQAVRNIQLPGKGVCSLACLANLANPDGGNGGWLACGMGDNSIVVCEPDTGKHVVTMRGHSGAVHALLWMETKGWLVSGSADATIRTWRLR